MSSNILPATFAHIGPCQRIGQRILDGHSVADQPLSALSQPVVGQDKAVTFDSKHAVLQPVVRVDVEETKHRGGKGECGQPQDREVLDHLRRAAPLGEQCQAPLCTELR